MNIANMERENVKPPAAGKKGAKPKLAVRPYQRPRGGEARGISDLMPEIGRAAFRRFGFVQSSVVTRWPEIVGDRYAAMSRPESISFPRGKKSEGTLNLLISGAQAVLMQHIEPEILERVNRFFGYRAVIRIKMRHGTLPPPEPKREPLKAAPQLRPIPAQLGESLRDIGDPELLTVLESLARSVAENDERKLEMRRLKSPDPKNWPKTGNVKPIDFTRFSKAPSKDNETQ